LSPKLPTMMSCSVCLKAGGCLAVCIVKQLISFLLHSTKIRNCGRKSPPLDPILSQLNPEHSLSHCNFQSDPCGPISATGAFPPLGVSNQKFVEHFPVPNSWNVLLPLLFLNLLPLTLLQ